MRYTVPGALILPLLLMAGCAIQPHLDQQAGVPPFDGVVASGPYASPGITRVDADDIRPAIDRVCRTGAMPEGYIAIDYADGGRDCPTPIDDGNRFTAAVIERYTTKPVGAIMIVCADQPTPNGWLREDKGEGSTTACRGARVSEGEPATRTIIRVRGASD